MSNLDAQGTIHTIGQTTEYGDNGFTKREFVIKLTGERESDEYPNYLEFELIKDKCSIMDAYQVGTAIKVGFNLQGRLWQGEGKPEKCFNALQAWKVEMVGGQAAPMAPQAPQAPQAPVMTRQQILAQYNELNGQEAVNNFWCKLSVQQQADLTADLA